MPPRKPNRLPVCRHVEIGSQLQEARDNLVHLAVELSRAYPKTSRQVDAASRASDAVDKLRSALDDASAGELPGDRWSTNIYYQANREQTAAELERVLRLHHADDPGCCPTRAAGPPSIVGNRPAGHRSYLFVRDSSISYEARGVLGAMVAAGRPMTVADLAALSPDPEQVVVDCLSELVSAGYIQDDPGGVYAPTAKAFQTGTDEP